MQFTDLFARLFSGSGPKGLSGEADSVLPGDPDLAFFNEGLRKGKADGDVVTAPDLLWSGGRGAKGGGSGILAHLQAEKPRDGVARFTDVLVIVNETDWKRSFENVMEPWTKRAAWLLGRSFNEYCNEEDLHLVFPQRPIGFRFIEDGGEHMEGEYLGLEAGEFVTGLLSNQYTDPGPASRKILTVHLNIPGAWEGYREVGSFYNDRILFTLGSHWLDSFHHPSLRIPALYRLQQYADGSFVHIIHPDYQDSYEITSHGGEGGGPAVLTLGAKGGEALCHMVLALADSTMNDEVAREQAAAAEAKNKEAKNKKGGRDPGPSAQTKAPATKGPAPMTEVPGGRNPTLVDMLGSHTVIPVELDERLLTLKERGVLLQKVHFGRFMDGYDVYIGPTGKISTHLAGERAAAIQVRRNEVSLLVQADDVSMNGNKLKKSTIHKLEADAAIRIGGVEVQYRSLQNVPLESWPYLGELVRPSGSSYMVFGSSYKIGRDRKNKVRLPDEPNNDNIVWRAEMDSGTIRSRTGEIPKSRFYTDSIMVASEHAEIDLREEPVLCSLARHCFTFVRRNNELLPLSPTQDTEGTQKAALRTGDQILIGNCVFEVGFPPAAGAPKTAEVAKAKPPAPLTAAALAAAAADEDVPKAKRPAVPEAPAKSASKNGPDTAPLPDKKTVPTVPLNAPTIASPPVAHGLGEEGPAPPRPRFSLHGGGADTFTSESKGDPKKARPPVAPVPNEPGEDEDTVEKPIGSRTEDPTERQPQVAFPPMLIEHDEDAGDPNTDLLNELLGDPDSLDGLVRAVNESDWQTELRRPARLRVEGWMVTGDVRIANHRGGQVVIPENRADRDQVFYPVDYFELFVRGKKGRVHLVSVDEARLVVAGTPAEDSERLDESELVVLRRTADGEVDFEVKLRLARDPALPDPRAMKLVLDTSDAMVQALFTIGLPLRFDRMVELGPIRALAMFDGEKLHLKDYLRSYRRSDGTYHPFFVRRAGASFQTVPEDGGDLVIEPGAELLAGGALYAFMKT